jgi:hypothetical protein
VPVWIRNIRWRIKVKQVQNAQNVQKDAQQ